jgi:cytochrome c oxidase subunit 2
MTRFITLFAMFVGLSPLGTPFQPPAQDAHTPKRIEIVARRFTFEPASITLKKGEPVVLVLKTSDVPHGVRFRDLNLELKASKSDSGEVQFTPDKVGDFVGHCSVFCGAGHGSMQMTIHVIG